MSILTGKDGTMHIGGSRVAPVTNWKLATTTAHRQYAANDTGGWTRRVPGVQDSAGSFLVRATDDGHCPVAESDAIALELHVDQSGLNYCGLSAVIEKIAIEVDIAHGEPIGYLVEFSGNGPVLRHGILAKTV